MTTYNLMLLPSGITDWDPDLRAELIAHETFLAEPDVLLLTELFDNSATDEHLFPRIARHHPYRTPVVGRTSSGWDRSTGGYHGFPLEDGGVAIASKWPILFRAQHIFVGGCGADYWAAKGFAYVVIDYRGQRVHLIGTHLQANDSACETGEARRERNSQLRAIRSFIDSRSIPANEPLVIGGDFNVRSGTSEYDSMLSTLQASPPLASQDVSYDPRTNSLAHYRSPNDSPGMLDHVFLSAAHPQPVLGWVNNVATRHSDPYIMRGSVFRDHSDHYPVTASPLSLRLPPN
ncbi:sphingomyelin phosphodiesterase [Streptomyces sp. NPDC085614]|uniref:sphingomyelin phosphodiesterase n=1 Tax=Streptomyces sp. NPDC085614 TaxID=3365733 RepID=UPI0037D7076E